MKKSLGIIIFVCLVIAALVPATTAMAKPIIKLTCTGTPDNPCP